MKGPSPVYLARKFPCRTQVRESEPPPGGQGPEKKGLSDDHQGSGAGENSDELDPTIFSGLPSRSP